MDQNFLFNMGLILIVIGLGLAYLFYARMQNKARDEDACDPQLMAVHTFFNDSLHELLTSMSGKIEDHFESEYGDGDGLFHEECAKHMKIVTDFNGWVSHVSGYPGWPDHVSSSWPANETDFYSDRIVRVATGPAEHKGYIIPFANLAHLVDCLAQMNKYHEELIKAIMRSEQ